MMWIIELFAIFFALGMFALFLFFISAVQILQVIVGVFTFIFIMPFAVVGTFIGNIVRQRR